MNSFEQMEAVIAQRRAEPQEGSYTCYLFEKGIDKILKKVGNLKKFHVSDHNT